MKKKPVQLVLFLLLLSSVVYSQHQYPLQLNDQFQKWYLSLPIDSVAYQLTKPDFSFSDAEFLFDRLDSIQTDAIDSKHYSEFYHFFHPKEDQYYFHIGSTTKILYGIPIDHYTFSSHHSSSFHLDIYPVIGIEMSDLKKGGKFLYGYQKHNYQGISATGSFGENNSFFVLVRDNQGKLNYDPPTARTSLPGVGYIKADKPYSVDFSEISAELTFPFAGGNLSVGKSNPNWSVNDESVVLSKNLVSFPNVRWQIHFDDQVYYEMLWAELVNFTPRDNDGLLGKKSMAAHRLVYQPIHQVRLSFFESVLYAEREFEPVYHIPFMFLKAAEHYNNSPDNANVGISAEWFINQHWYAGFQFLIDDITTNQAFSDSTNNKLATLAGISYNDQIFGKYFTAKLTAAYATKPTYFHHDLATQYFHYGDALGLNVYRSRLNLKLEAEYNLFSWIYLGGSIGNWKLTPAYYYDGSDYFFDESKTTFKSFSVKIIPTLPFQLEFKLFSIENVTSQTISLKYGIW